MCTPSTERADPFSVSSSCRANTMVGRLCWSFNRPATIPITPWWNASSNSTMAFGTSPSRSSEASVSSACCFMSCSMVLRCWLSLSSSTAIARACMASLHNKHSMPAAISSSLPAALSLGPTTNPRSDAVILAACRWATSSIAVIPGRQRPARIRCNP